MELSGDRNSADFFLILFYISYKLKSFAQGSTHQSRFLGRGGTVRCVDQALPGPSGAWIPGFAHVLELGSSCIRP